ncbi:UBA TS N domain [Trypanosoma vivax]|nr:UBA TS N domain [Trypanosoma vivax]
MVLEHAPVTGILLGLSFLSSIRTTQSNVAHQFAQTSLDLKTTLMRLPLLSLPFGAIGISLTDVACTMLVLFQMRTLERRWGSPPFLTFVVTAVLAGSVLLCVLVTESRPPLTVDQLRILSSGGSIVPLAALSARFVIEVPSLHQWTTPFAWRVPTGRLPLLLPLARLVICPSTEFFIRTQRQRIVHADIGLKPRLVLAIVGILLGITSSKSRLLSWWFDSVTRFISRPLFNIAKPVLRMLFTTDSTAELSLPEESNGVRNTLGGRYTVDNLVGAQTIQNPWLGENRRPNERSFASGGHRRRRQGPNEGEQVGDVRITDELVTQILELGMGFDVDTIHSALAAANGNVNAAVDILMSTR